MRGARTETEAVGERSEKGQRKEGEREGGREEEGKSSVFVQFPGDAELSRGRSVGEARPRPVSCGSVLAPPPRGLAEAVLCST